MIKIVEIRSDASNVVEDAVNRLSSAGLTMQFIDRLTLKVWNGAQLPSAYDMVRLTQWAD
jgi:hypothetical protein